ncbi:MAG: hypothetical protein OER56_17300, partial [Hyphomicrobiales bacterium]|nr:hypothetical protein [Hyphomicrobiales bacterium]
GNWHLVAVAIAVPAMHAYFVPAIGTNILGVWQFNSTLKIGHFRPQHGFVFGSATALITLAVMAKAEPVLGIYTLIETAVLCGLLLLAVNWIYDALAIRAGYLEVFNQPWADGRGPWAIAADYAIWFFGLFGLIYGAGLRLAEATLLASPQWFSTAIIILLTVAATALFPALGYCAATFWRYGHTGLKPCRRPSAAGENQWLHG